MRIKDTEIPQAAIDAATAAMTGTFTAGDVQKVIAGALAADGTFAYPPGRFHGIPDRSQRDRDELDMRVADRLIQKARRSGEIVFSKGRWTKA